MHWKLLFLTSLLGLALALGAVFILPADIEPLCYLLITCLSAVIIGTKLQSLYAIHGFVLGLLFTFWNIIIRLLFFSTYSKHHPEDLDKIVHRLVEGHLHIKLVVFGIIAGTLYSMVLALFSWISSRMIKTT